jgi:hypothetical protein
LSCLWGNRSSSSDSSCENTKACIQCFELPIQSINQSLLFHNIHNRLGLTGMVTSQIISCTITSCSRYWKIQIYMSKYTLHIYITGGYI